MAWTYSGNPGTSAIDEVRFLVGDTNPDDQLVTDEEIAFVLTVHGDVATVNYQAAAVVAEGIANKFARLTNKSVGSLSSSAEQKYLHYVEVAERLRGLASTEGRSGKLGAVPILLGGGPTYLGGPDEIDPYFGT